MHFDSAATFVIQIAGTKRWFIGENTDIPFPTERHSVTMPRMHSRLTLQGTVPAAPVREALTEVVLEPGSILFMPHGWWHEVEATTESFALMVVILDASWADLFCRRLYQTLITDSRWREFPWQRCPGSTLPAGFRKVTGQIDQLIDELTASPHISCSTMTTPLYGKRPETKLTKSDGAFHVKCYENETRIETPKEDWITRVVSEIESVSGLFSVEEVSARSGVAERYVFDLVRALLEAEYLFEE